MTTAHESIQSMNQQSQCSCEFKFKVNHEFSILTTNEIVHTYIALILSPSLKPNIQIVSKSSIGIYFLSSSSSEYVDTYNPGTTLTPSQYPLGS
jgi:hypothetical protein